MARIQNLSEMEPLNPQKKQWQSQLGFILTASGAAVGLGNIQRFPYVVAENGGAAFLLLYLLCIILIGFPLVISELALGRATGKNPAATFKVLSKSKNWQLVGLLGIATSFFILTYYMILAGWTFVMTINMMKTIPLDFSEVKSNLILGVVTSLSLYGAMGTILAQGLNKGLEKVSKFLMPFLLILLLFLVIYCSFLPGAVKGYEFYLFPDFGKLKTSSFLEALGQAFFSLCIGEAVLLTYGSYSSKKKSLATSATAIVTLDTLVAFMAGLVIFPALFSANKEIPINSQMIFHVMPALFENLPYGRICGTFFFFLLFLASFTTCMALMEVPVNYLRDEKRVSSTKGISLVLTPAALITLIILFSQSRDLKVMGDYQTVWGQKDLFDLFDLIWGNGAMIISGLGVSLFAGWVLPSKVFLKEVSHSSPFLEQWGSLLLFSIRYICPPLILLILFSYL